MLPLEGVTVVSLEQAVAAPFATRQLADLGARVIKVERPAGDFARGYDTSVQGLSSHFVWLNRNKESIVLDLKAAADRAVMDQLLDRADVFVQNLAPGAAGRLGLGAAELRAKDPRLIVCDLSGYGSSGPYRDKKAYDLLIQCETGLVSITGSPDEPAKTGISTADIAGGMYAYTGVLTALYERERTGRGTAFEVSLFDALGEWMGFPYYYSYSGTEPPRAGARHAAIAPYGPFAAGDGSQVFLGVQNEREWVKFCEQVLDQPGLAGDPRFDANPKRVANVFELKIAIEAVFAAMSSEQIERRLEHAGIANARMRTVSEFAEHPQLAARDRWREVDSPAGPLRTLLPPVTVPGREPRMDPIPEIGEHTQAILAELGGHAEPPCD
ncbi:Crotonobetainyl-CoA:carnitine CoA-transferase CaiB [Saccharopolyspora antimicrobica]|uniref:Crotonobetainyl-CoA:carnitine CoA-transferase CaiB n=1 Tax=Saccharopolyspora antimicrobica TaxID=455193 RepID=A0A1I5H0S6_9PSEU|nr:CaiB/BaiF CoA-transferase family protein [Saccharopolyspora antimicrobica]RKT90062.1 crotonobetainyl-CoA:carnitine CoA-transferase CaiB-like acyl-CoA transferase [Saccharopolyspora antimicrobica]SFO41807.1 Crotonobetainyl-CoA:carnitine CoA-transferase CaiB [Saccharopolyspora antimicrobica]